MVQDFKQLGKGGVKYLVECDCKERRIRTLSQSGTVDGVTGSNQRTPTSWEFATPESKASAVLGWVCHPLFNPLAWLYWFKS